MAASASAVSDQLNTRNFKRLADFIQDYSGIKMPQNKRTMLEGRLRRRLRATGHDSINDYCRYLFEEDGMSAEVIHLIDAVTTNKTDFFREPVHFNFLKTTALPQIVDAGRRHIKTWSAASSTGAEPYTLAMVLDAFCETRPGVDYSILATDLSTQVLDQTLLGAYPESVIEPVPMAMRKRYLMRAKDPARKEVRIVPHLRSKLSVARLNLMDDIYPVDGDFDLIFCRNILIYFDKPTQGKVLTRLCDHLRPSGYLVLGHSESIVGINLPVDQIANTMFQRR